MSSFQNFVDSCLAQNTKQHAYQVGIVDSQTIEVLQEYDIEIATKEIYLTQNSKYRLIQGVWEMQGETVTLS